MRFIGFSGVAALTLILFFNGCKKTEVSSLSASSGAVRFYGTPDGNVLKSFTPTADGGFMFGGYTESNVKHHGKGFIQKTDAHGKVLWYKTYGGSRFDIFNAVKQITDGGYIAAGVTTSMGNGVAQQNFRSDGYLVKTDADGNLLWQKSFGWINNDRFFDVMETKDHGFVATGTMDTANFTKIYVVKTDANGNTFWTKRIFSTKFVDFSLGLSIASGPNGEIAIAGQIMLIDSINGSFNFLPCYAYLAPDGKTIVNEIRYRSFGQCYENYSQYDAVNRNLKIIPCTGGFVFAVNFNNPASTTLFSIDYSGNIKWQQTLASDNHYKFIDLTADPAGNMLICGYSTTDYTLFNSWLSVLDAGGNKLRDIYTPVPGYQGAATGAVKTGNHYDIGLNLHNNNSYYKDNFGYMTVNQDGKCFEKDQ